MGTGGLPPFYWTFNGQPLAGGGIPVLPMPGWTWLWQGDQRGHFQIGLANDNSTPISIRSVRVFQPAALQPLSNLNMAAVQGLTPIWQSSGPPVSVNPGIQSFFDVFLEVGDSVPPPTENTPLIAVAIIDNPLAPPTLSTINLLAQTTFVMPPPPEYCYNWDFINDTGMAVNDLHIVMRGPRVLADVYMGPLNPFGGPGPGSGFNTGPLNPFGLPDPASGYHPVEDVYHLNWSGATVAPGGVVHVGFCTDLPLVDFPGVGGLPPHYWTFNGAPINPATPISVPGYEWQWMNDGSLEFGLSLAPSQPAVAIDAIQIAPVAALFDLDDLTYATLGAQVPAGAWSPMTPLGGATLNPGQQIFFAPPPGLQVQPRQALVVRFRAIDALDPTRIIWVAAQARAGGRAGGRTTTSTCRRRPGRSTTCTWSSAALGRKASSASSPRLSSAPRPSRAMTRPAASPRSTFCRSGLA